MGSPSSMFAVVGIVLLVGLLGAPTLALDRRLLHSPSSPPLHVIDPWDLGIK